MAEPCERMSLSDQCPYYRLVVTTPVCYAYVCKIEYEQKKIHDAMGDLKEQIVSTRDIYNKLLNIESALLRMHDMLYAELIRIREKI